MGLAFGSSLQQFLERISEPVHDFFAPAQPKADAHHEMLWDCYLSGQMTDADLDREINADPSFAAFVQAHEKHFH
jgi:hypothetical protein